MSRRQVGWRFPEALVRRVENYAERERRSVNRAAEVLLEQALEAAEKDRLEQALEAAEKDREGGK